MNAIKWAVAAFLVLLSLDALGHEYKAGALTIDHPWVRVTIQGRPAAGYMTVTNTAVIADKLVSASSPVAERVELHTHLMEDAVMKMRPVDVIEVPANGEVELAPGGLHFMIFGLKDHLEGGDSVPITVVFEHAGSIDMDFTVGEAGNDGMH